MGLWGPRVATVTTPVPSLSLGQSEQFPAHPADKAMAGTLAHTRPHTHCGKSGSYSVGCRIPAGNTAERAWSAGDPSHLQALPTPTTNPTPTPRAHPSSLHPAPTLEVWGRSPLLETRKSLTTAWPRPRPIASPGTVPST